MSLFSSLTTTVGGLAAQSASISNVSNNLANTSTYAYKAKHTSFEAMVSNNATSSSSGGVRSSTEYENSVQGTTSSYDVSTYMALDGSGYFAVKTATKNPDGTLAFSDQVDYTRRGDFTIDANGYLVNGAGYYLLGWDVNPTTGAVNTSSTTPIQVSQLLDAPAATSSVDYQANLPASATVNTTTSTSTISVYDALGSAHDMSYYWVKQSTDVWDLFVNVKNGYYDSGTSSYSDFTAEMAYTFHSSATATASVGSIANIATIGSNGTVTLNNTTYTASYNLTFDGAGSQDVTSLFANMTQYDDTDISVSTFSQNGIARGSFSSVSIDETGNVTVNYDNGQSKTYYEIPVATFNAENELQEQSGDAYSSTISSGSARLCTAGTLGAATVASQSLESSNVDIATEFSSLIVSQQVYSANAKTITTIDDMLSTLLNSR